MRLTTACQGVPECEFVAPHAGGHGAVLHPAGTYCAPLRCYCGDCPAPPVLEADPLTLEQARAAARLEAARWRARQAAREAARRAVKQAPADLERLTARQSLEADSGRGAA